MTNREDSTDAHTLPRIKRTASGKLVRDTELGSVLCDDLERQGGRWVGGRFKRQGICVHIQLTHVTVTL